MWEVVDYFQRWWILMRMRWGSFPLDSYNLFPNFFIYILRKKINHPGRRGLGSAKRWYWHICGGREVIWKPLKKFVTKSKLSFLKVNYLKLKRLKKIPNKCKNLNQCGWRCICSAKHIFWALHHFSWSWRLERNGAAYAAAWNIKFPTELQKNRFFNFILEKK